MSKHGVIPGPYFPVFGLNTEIYGVVSIRKQHFSVVFTLLLVIPAIISHGKSLSQSVLLRIGDGV